MARIKNSLQIRKMKQEDLPKILEIENDCFPTPWTENSFQRELREINYSRYLSALISQELVGYIGGWLILDELHITNLAVKEDYRRQGIASRLLEGLLEIAREQGSKYARLEVRQSNKAARRLYGAYGFEKVGLRKNYYRDNGEDALLMRKEFADGIKRNGEQRR